MSTSTLTNLITPSVLDVSSYTVTASTGTGDGTIALRLANTTGITDPVGVALAAATLTGPVYAIDRTKPTIAFVGNAGSYGLLDTVHITCTATDPGSSPSGLAVNPCVGFSIRSVTLTTSSSSGVSSIEMGVAPTSIEPLTT